MMQSGRALGRGLDHWSGALLSRTHAYESPELPHRSDHVRTSGEDCPLWTRNQTPTFQRLDLGLPSLPNWEINVLFISHPGYGIVMAAQTDSDARLVFQMLHTLYFTRGVCSLGPSGSAPPLRSLSNCADALGPVQGPPPHQLTASPTMSPQTQSQHFRFMLLIKASHTTQALEGLGI